MTLKARLLSMDLTVQKSLVVALLLMNLSLSKVVLVADSRKRLSEAAAVEAVAVMADAAAEAVAAAMAAEAAAAVVAEAIAAVDLTEETTTNLFQNKSLVRLLAG